MKIIVFGIGNIYKKYRKYINAEDKVVAFIDNNIQMHGKKIDKINIYSPLQIFQISYDKIVIMSDYSVEMRNQLLKIGCPREDIVHYLEYVSFQNKGKWEIFETKKQRDFIKKGIILTSSLGYHGGAITAVYAALSLQNMGYKAIVAAPDGDINFINEFQEKGISFLIYPNLKFAKWDEILWLDEFQKIIVNTYPMILCALEIGKHRNVLFWIHESDCVYESMEFWKDEILARLFLVNLDMYAVSNAARLNFMKNIAYCKMKVLSYGIPESYKEVLVQKDYLTFAVVGTIFPIKQQLLYIEAIKKLDKLYQLQNEFLIIGDVGDEKYAKKVKEEIETFKNINLIGGLKRKELERKYINIDVLVIVSAQETMSLVATEAMMYGKTCIVCDVAGMAEFVKHKKNGLIFSTNNATSLARQMTFCIENKNMLKLLGFNARKTYCKYFTMKRFEERLEKALND